MGALSKLDEFLLNPQVRTCSAVVPGTSRNYDSENREPTGDGSLGDPCREAVFSTYHSSNLNDSEQEETHHMVTGVQVMDSLSSSHCDRSSRRDSLLLLWKFIRKTKEGALYKSAKISQRKHPSEK